MTAGFLLPPVMLSAADVKTAGEREIALWVLRKGGAVLPAGAEEYTRDPFDLPAGELHVAGVDMHGTVLDPKELEPLRGLTDLRELYIPARVWSPASDIKAPYSDEMFDFFTGMKKLENFEAGLTTLAWLDLWDVGLARLAPLAQLKDLRIALSTIKDPKCLASFVNLETLDLNDTYVTDQTLTALAGMKKLRRLTMVGTLVTDEGIRNLQDLTELQVLDLYGVKITDVGVRYLRRLTKLEELNLLGAQITDESANVLAGFKDLRVLNLYRSRLTNAGLAKLQSLQKLELLDVRYSSVNDSGIEAMRAAHPECRIAYVGNAPPAAGAPGRPKGTGEKAIAAWIQSLGAQAQMRSGRLISVSLARVPFRDEQLAYLKPLAHLERLSLESADISDRGLDALQGLTALRDLDLSYTSVSDTGLAKLANLVKLERLALAGVLAKGTGFQHFDRLMQLHDLSLASSPVTDQALPYIAKLAALERLDLSNSDVTDSGLLQLAKLANWLRSTCAVWMSPMKASPNWRGSRVCAI